MKRFILIIIANIIPALCFGNISIESNKNISTYNISANSEGKILIIDTNSKAEVGCIYDPSNLDQPVPELLKIYWNSNNNVATIIYKNRRFDQIATLIKENDRFTLKNYDISKIPINIEYKFKAKSNNSIYNVYSVVADFGKWITDSSFTFNATYSANVNKSEEQEINCFIDYRVNIPGSSLEIINSKIDK
jgi:hypothetical protein